MKSIEKRIKRSRMLQAILLVLLGLTILFFIVSALLFISFDTMITSMNNYTILILFGFALSFIYIFLVLSTTKLNDVLNYEVPVLTVELKSKLEKPYFYIHGVKYYLFKEVKDIYDNFHLIKLYRADMEETQLAIPAGYWKIISRLQREEPEVFYKIINKEKVVA